MSLIVPESSLSFSANYEFLDNYPMVSYTFFSVVLSIVFLRGLASFSGDLVRAGLSVFSKKYKEVGVQTTESSFKCPDQITSTK